MHGDVTDPSKCKEKITGTTNAADTKDVEIDI